MVWVETRRRMVGQPSAYIHRRAIEKSRARARLVIVHKTIRVLLEIKLLSGPRTQNAPDLGAVNRALV